MLLHKTQCDAIDSKINTSRRKQDGRHFPDDFFKSIFLNENVLISMTISVNFVPNGPIMAWRPAIIWTNDDQFTDAYMHHQALMS